MSSTHGVPKVLLINPFEKLPGEPFRDQRYTGLYRYLKDRADVLWLSGDFHHWSHSRRRAESLPEEDRARIVLVPMPAYRRNIGLARLLSYGLLSWRTRRYLRAMAFRPAVVLVVGPIEMEYWVVRWARSRGVRVVVDVIDPWPDVFVRPLPRGLRWLGVAALAPLFAMSRYVYRRADHVTAVSETYRAWAERRGGRRHAESSSVHYLGAWGYPDRVRARATGRRLRCLFAGQFEYSYDLRTVIEAARLCRGRGVEVEILLAGDGRKRAELEARAAGLENVSFLGWLGTEALAEVGAGCDVGLSCYVEKATQSLPTKLFDYLAMGLYVVNSLPGEMAELLAQHGIGESYRAGDGEALAEVLARCATRLDEVREGGDRAQRFFREHCRGEDVARRMAEELLLRPGPSPGRGGRP